MLQSSARNLVQSEHDLVYISPSCLQVFRLHSSRADDDRPDAEEGRGQGHDDGQDGPTLSLPPGMHARSKHFCPFCPIWLSQV